MAKGKAEDKTTRRMPAEGNVFVRVRHEALAPLAAGSIEVDRERGGVRIPDHGADAPEVEVPERTGVAMARSRPDVYAVVREKGD